MNLLIRDEAMSRLDKAKEHADRAERFLGGIASGNGRVFHPEDTRSGHAHAQLATAHASIAAILMEDAKRPQ